MKKIIFFIILSFSFSQLPVFAQNDDPEKASPMMDTEIVRRVKQFDIEGFLYTDVDVIIKSISPDDIFTDKYRVKVKVTDASDKIVWKKTLKNVFLYVFPDGQVQVGKPNFNKLIIYSDKTSDNKYKSGKIREKEGEY